MKQKNLILMAVAIVCGLAAAFLTSQLSARSAVVEQEEVLVAAADIPVGTMLNKDELPKLVKPKKLPKDGLPPAYVKDLTELAGKRLTRAVRAEETINPADLSKGGVITLPPGMHMVSLQVGAAQAAAGFVGPGSRVDILATLRLTKSTVAFPLLVNMLVVAVDTQTTYSDKGTFPTLNTVSFAVNRQQALLIELAKTRGCGLSLMLRHPEETANPDDKYKVEDVLKMLQDESSDGRIGGAKESQPEDGAIGTRKKDEPKAEKPEPKAPPEPTPAPKEAVVKVLVAAEDIPAGTVITKDLFAKFVAKEFRKADVEDAFADLTPLLDQQFKFGVAKGQWVTGALVGKPGLKGAPPVEFVPEKDGPNAQKADKPARPARATHDVTLHTASGSKVFRYEEVRPGEWKLQGEVAPDKEPEAKGLASPQID